ncbi:MAG: NUDIX hydrolase [Chloroflexota bacterium]
MKWKHPGDKHWEVKRTEPGPDLVLFNARYDWVINPRNGAGVRAVVLEGNDWVNVVALTPEKKILMVRQFRFGVQAETIEIPAGMVEPGEPPLQAAVRELQEETGFTTEDWTSMGSAQPNPAFLANTLYLFLAQNVVQTHQPNLDTGEDMDFAAVTIQEVKEGIAEGQIRNALGLLALGRVFDLRQVQVD